MCSQLLSAPGTSFTNYLYGDSIGKGLYVSKALHVYMHVQGLVEIIIYLHVYFLIVKTMF